MKDSVLVRALGLFLASEYQGLELGAGSFLSFDSVVMRDREFTSKILRRIGRNQMAEVNAVVQERDAGLSVQVSSRAPWGGLSFLVLRAKNESQPRFRPWQRVALLAIAGGALTAYIVWSIAFGRIWPNQLRADIDGLRVRVEQLEDVSVRDK